MTPRLSDYDVAAILVLSNLPLHGNLHISRSRLMGPQRLETNKMHYPAYITFLLPSHDHPCSLSIRSGYFSVDIGYSLMYWCCGAPG